MRIEVRPKTAEHAAQWRCTHPDCDQRDQWHIVADTSELNTQALGHAEQKHGEKAWLHFAGGES